MNIEDFAIGYWPNSFRYVHSSCSLYPIEYTFSSYLWISGHSMFFSYWMSSYFGTLFLFWIGLVDSFILLVDWLSFYATLLGINKHNYYLLSNRLFLAIVGSKKNITIVGSIVSISYSNYCWMA